MKKTTKKIILWVVAVLVLAFLGVVATGVIKFNILQDDIYYDGGNLQNDIKYLEGTWIEVSPQPEYQQGFTLQADGTASSVNMATLVYKHWELDGQILKLTYDSIGNGQTIEGVEQFLVNSYGQGELRLEVIRESGTQEFIYKKRD